MILLHHFLVDSPFQSRLQVVSQCIDFCSLEVSALVRLSLEEVREEPSE